MIKSAAVIPLVGALALSVPGNGVAATSLGSGVGLSASGLSYADECQECMASVIFVPSVQKWFGQWATYEGDGLCPQWAETCVICDAGDCVDRFDVDNFDTEEDAWDWVENAITCPDHCSISRETPSTDNLSSLTELTSRQLSEVLLASDGALWLNVERGAVQGRTCSSALSVHLPLSARSVRETAAYLEQLTVGASRALTGVAGM